MSETKFTPGPWDIVENQFGEISIMREVIVNGDLADFTLAEIMLTGADDHPEHQRGNAALIAAAPALYEQHESSVTGLELLRLAIIAGDPQNELLQRVADLRDEARAALSKALPSSTEGGGE